MNRIDPSATLLADRVARDLAVAQGDAIGAVNAGAGRVRAAFVTEIPGQEMLYVYKAAEAARFLAEATPPTDLTTYPLIAAEIGITGATATDVATTYNTQAGLWQVIAAQLETIRLGAIAAIEAATMPSEIATALTTFETQITAMEASL